MRFEQAKKIVTQHGLALLQDPTNALRAVAVGRAGGGAVTSAKEDEFAVVAYVDRRVDDAELRRSGVRSFNAAIFQATGTSTVQQGGAIAIEVRESLGPYTPTQPLQVPAAQRGVYGGNPPALNAQKPFSEVRCGIGINNPTADGYPQYLSVGTLGFHVRDDSGQVYLVSNNHVIAGENTSDSNQDTAVRGNPIVQPGTLDFTTAELQMMPTLADVTNQLQIATLTAWVPLRTATSAVVHINHVDAALARLANPTNGVQRTYDGIDRSTYGGCVLAQAAPYEVDDDGAIDGSARVYKVGRTTGYTEGEVVGIAGAVTIPYRQGPVYYQDQLLIAATPDNTGPFSDRGDSGSGILNDAHELVGLLFAGSPAQTIANPIDLVLTELGSAAGLNLTLVTGP